MQLMCQLYEKDSEVIYLFLIDNKQFKKYLNEKLDIFYEDINKYGEFFPAFALLFTHIPFLNIVNLNTFWFTTQ